MVECPNCHEVSVIVKDTWSDETTVYRKRLCRTCGYEYYTSEKDDPSVQFVPQRAQKYAAKKKKERENINWREVVRYGYKRNN